MAAVVPLFPAWALTLAITYDVALAGMYVFLRRQGVSSTAATFGAVTFAFAGYMTAQIVHVDLITGTSWLPWMLVAVHGLTERRPTYPGTGDEGRPVVRGSGSGSSCSAWPSDSPCWPARPSRSSTVPCCS